MKKRTLAFGLVASLNIVPVCAAIVDATGDIDIGISRDVMESTSVCKNPNTYFQLIEMIADGKRDQGIRMVDAAIAKGDCLQVKAQSVTVTSVRMAKISGAERKVASIYVLVRVRGRGFDGYVAPSTLSERGVDIIRTAQLMNKRNGAPLVQ